MHTLISSLWLGLAERNHCQGVRLRYDRTRNWVGVRIEHDGALLFLLLLLVPSFRVCRLTLWNLYTFVALFSSLWLQNLANACLIANVNVPSVNRGYIWLGIFGKWRFIYSAELEATEGGAPITTSTS